MVTLCVLLNLVVESHLLTDFGTLCLFASSLIEDVS